MGLHKLGGVLLVQNLRNRVNLRPQGEGLRLLSDDLFEGHRLELADLHVGQSIVSHRPPQSHELLDVFDVELKILTADLIRAVLAAKCVEFSPAAAIGPVPRARILRDVVAVGLVYGLR